MSTIISSENLVTNRRHREKWGAKVDSMEEAIVVIQNGIEKVVDDANGAVGPFEDKLPHIGEACRTPGKEITSETVQLTVKLFLRENDRQVAQQAVNKVKQMLSEFSQTRFLVVELCPMYYKGFILT